MKIGYRDRVVSNEEISCTGCNPENWCRYHVAKCCNEHGIGTCGECREYPCERIQECFAVTKSFETDCRKACTEAEFRQLETAFFEKEKHGEADPAIDETGTETPGAPSIAPLPAGCPMRDSDVKELAFDLLNVMAGVVDELFWDPDDKPAA